MKNIIAIGALLLLAACNSVGPASLAGECEAFHDPGFAVQGKRLIDKKWIGNAQETGIRVCGWKRPKQ